MSLRNMDFIAYRKGMLIKNLLELKEMDKLDDFIISCDLTFKITEKRKLSTGGGTMINPCNSLLTVFSDNLCILQQLGVGLSMDQFKSLFVWIRNVIGTPTMIITDTCCDDTKMFIEVFGDEIETRIKLDLSHFTHR